MYIRFLLLLVLFIPLLATPGDEVVLAAVQSDLPHWGILKEQEGFVYLDLEDAYVHQLVTLIEEYGFEEPPYFGSPDLVGAHITVMYTSEAQNIPEIKEYGELFFFEPKECIVVHPPPSWKEVDEAYLIVVDAPELQAIRTKYGLPETKYALHITIGVKRPQALAA